MDYRALSVLLIIVILLSACAGSDAVATQTPGAPSQTEAVVTAADAQQPIWTPRAPSGPPPTWTPAPEVHGSTPPTGDVLYFLQNQSPRVIVAYDIAAGRVYWTRNLGYGTDRSVVVPTFKVTMLGGQIAVSNGESIQLLNADGTDAGVFYHLPGLEEHIEDIAASADGHLLAVAVAIPGRPVGTPAPDGAQEYRGQSEVRIFDASGGLLRTVSQDQPALSEFGGFFYWLNWRNDGRGVVISGATSSERPGGAATLFLDGRIQPHPVEGYGDIAPNGRLMAHGPSTFGCLAIAGHSLSILDLDTNRSVITTGSETEALTGLEWSPDSKEYLFSVRPFDSSLDCGFDPRVPEELRVLDVVSGVVHSVPDRRALFQRWYGTELIEAKGCGFVDGPLDASRWREFIVVCLPSGGVGVGSFLLDGHEVSRSDYFELVGWSRK